MVGLSLYLTVTWLLYSCEGYSTGRVKRNGFFHGQTSQTQYTSLQSSGHHSCNRRADIVFLFDDSESITKNDPDNYEQMKKFMKDVVNSFTSVGSEGAQFSSVSFARNVKDNFFLKDYNSRAGLVSAIDKLQSSKGSATGIGRGLQHVYKNSFRRCYGGGRGGVREIVVILTDGKNNIPPSPESQAQLLKNNGVIIVAVGVGSNVDMGQLRRVASRPDFVFHVNSFSALSTIRRGVVGVACQECTRRQPTPSCSRKEDIVFLFDDSNSINSNDPQNFNRMKVFMKDVVDSFTTIGTSGTQFSSVCFAKDVKNHFYLKDYGSGIGVKAAIDAIIPSHGEATAIGLGLQFVALNSFLLDNGGQRHGARQLVIVLTDGKNNHGPTPVEEAKKLKDIGVTIITIGVGSNVDVTQLAQIASASDLVFHVGSFSTLFTIRENIVIAACQESEIVEIPSGPVGEKGPRGDKGPDGDKGEKGKKGAKGDKGNKGTKGSDGTPGGNGSNGKDGVPGKDGETGPRGAPGKQGTKGEKGDKGSRGQPGEMGEQGITGKPGKDGRNGKNGKPGGNGKPGTDGKPGADGKPGTDGKPGADGKDGKNGVLHVIFDNISKGYGYGSKSSGYGSKSSGYGSKSSGYGGKSSGYGSKSYGGPPSSTTLNSYSKQGINSAISKAITTAGMPSNLHYVIRGSGSGTKGSGSSYSGHGSILSPSKGYSSKGSGYSSKGSGYSSKGSGYSSKGSGYSSKGSGYISKGSGYSSKGSGYHGATLTPSKGSYTKGSGYSSSLSHFKGSYSTGSRYGSSHSPPKRRHYGGSYKTYD